MTDHVPAAAEGLPKINRRRFLASSASAAAVIGSGTAVAAAIPHFDPMLDLVQRFNAVNTHLNVSDINEDDEVFAYCAANIDPLLDEMRDDPPPVTTELGAIETLRLATNTGRLGDPEIILQLNRAVLAFLEGRA